METLLRKRTLGQFFTENDLWLKDHILDFIENTNAKVALDPFAGNGDLLKVAKKLGFKKALGFDIDPSLSWRINDSLLNIPRIPDSITITNPPYFTNYSAKRRGLYNNVKKYFDLYDYDDLYQLAIDRCFANDFGVMIIPETFINSRFPHKSRLHSITIIEDALFNDTDNPVCVICFDNKQKLYKDIAVYKDDRHLGNLEYFEKFRLFPRKDVYIKFNSTVGQVALRAVDGVDPQKKIAFMKPYELDYDLAGIKESSRLITYIELGVQDRLVDKVINISNELLTDFRKRTHDILLSPFKGNRKDGRRRRRLDYLTARAILESAFDETQTQGRLEKLN